MFKVIQLYFSGIQNIKIYYSFKTEFERLSSMYCILLLEFVRQILSSYVFAVMNKTHFWLYQEVLIKFLCYLLGTGSVYKPKPKFAYRYALLLLLSYKTLGIVSR